MPEDFRVLRNIMNPVGVLPYPNVERHRQFDIQDLEELGQDLDREAMFRPWDNSDEESVPPNDYGLPLPHPGSSDDDEDAEQMAPSCLSSSGGCGVEPTQPGSSNDQPQGEVTLPSPMHAVIAEPILVESSEDEGPILVESS